MNALLEQFLSESREFTQGIGDKLMQLESAPTDQDVINELFRLVHTLKGNSGLFTFPEMTRVLHAGEDLLGLVRNGRVDYSRELADRLLDAMDLVMEMCHDIEATEKIDASRAGDSIRMAASLRALMPSEETRTETGSGAATPAPAGKTAPASISVPPLGEIPENLRIEAFRRSGDGETLHWITYLPVPECFFQGDDPFHLVRQTPGLLWGIVLPSEPLPPLVELDS